MALRKGLQPRGQITDEEFLAEMEARRPARIAFTFQDEGKDILNEPTNTTEIAMMSRYLMLTEGGFEYLRAQVFEHPGRLNVEQIGQYLDIGGRTTTSNQIRRWRESGQLNELRNDMLVIAREEWDITMHTVARAFGEAVLNMLNIARFQTGKTAVDAFNAVKPFAEKMLGDSASGEENAADKFINDRKQLPGGQKSDG